MDMNLALQRKRIYMNLAQHRVRLYSCAQTDEIHELCPVQRGHELSTGERERKYTLTWPGTEREWT
jgi:hypothetical protein